jgi:hypothetical protein
VFSVTSVEWPRGGSRDNLTRPTGDELDWGVRGICDRVGLVSKMKPEKIASIFFTLYLKLKYKFFGL